MPQHPDETRSAVPSASRLFLIAAVVVIVLAADLALKSWAFRHVAGQPVVLSTTTPSQPDIIPAHAEFVVVPSLLSLKLTINHGAVFGIGAGNRSSFIAVGGLAIIFIIIMLLRTSKWSRTKHVLLALIFVGALGNMYDRIAFGVVRDMLYLFPGVSLPFGWHWAHGNREIYPWIFNLADVALVGGLLSLGILTMFKCRSIAT